MIINPKNQINGVSPHLTPSLYEQWYEASIIDPEGFWHTHGQRLDWIKPYTTVKNVSFDHRDPRIQWYEDGTLNVAYNCVDRHLRDKANQTAFIWERDKPGRSETYTYQDLYDMMGRWAWLLKSLGVKKGDRVALYMPMIPDAVAVMLACARLGAVHSVVFAGFSSASLAGRMKDCDAKVLVTADYSYRGGKEVSLLDSVTPAMDLCPKVQKCVVFQTKKTDVSSLGDRYIAAQDVLARADASVPPVEVSAEDPLFILYTSGSTGKPKGIYHTSGGYLVYAAMTHQYIFDYHPGDIYWCTADIGWITGHSYVVYGPLANGATSVLFEGVPTYPDPSRLWHMVDEHQITQLYTAPTAIRSLMAQGDRYLETTSRSSLRVLGSVGEPINPDPWLWYYHSVGKSQASVVDTWWQTETGGILISPIPGVTPMKPGSASKPFFGINPILLDSFDQPVVGEAEGRLCISDSWPGQMRGVWSDPQRFRETYFSPATPCYISGDGAKRDEDGFLWITGRMDDVLNVSGHRLGSAEIENALLTHKAVAESAVVGLPHEIKGESLCLFVTLRHGYTETKELHQSFNTLLRQHIGPIASLDRVIFTPVLPKTRSGKIMRRILRKLAQGQGDLGDISTLADPSCIDIIKHVMEKDL